MLAIYFSMTARDYFIDVQRAIALPDGRVGRASDRGGAFRTAGEARVPRHFPLSEPTARLSQRESVFCGSLFGNVQTFLERSNLTAHGSQQAVMQDTLPTGGSDAQATGEGRLPHRRRSPSPTSASPSPSLRLDSPRGRVSFVGHSLETFKRCRTRLSMAVMQDTLPSGGSDAQATGEGRLPQFAGEARVPCHFSLSEPTARLSQRESVFCGSLFGNVQTFLETLKRYLARPQL